MNEIGQWIFIPICFCRPICGDRKTPSTNQRRFFCHAKQSRFGDYQFLVWYVSQTNWGEGGGGWWLPGASDKRLKIVNASIELWRVLFGMPWWCLHTTMVREGGALKWSYHCLPTSEDIAETGKHSEQNANNTMEIESYVEPGS